MQDVKLSIIIVSWNVVKDLQICLDSIYKFMYLTPNHSKAGYGAGFEVIVVDNHSSDNTVEILTKDYPQVRLLANKQNRGFATANNEAMNIAKGEYLLFLNPDTYFIDEHSIPTALEYLNEHPNTLLTGNVLNKDHTNQVAVRKLPTLYSQIITLLKLNNIFPTLNKVYHLRNFDYNKIQEVNSIIGAFMLIKASTMRSMNGFDEDYFVWFEEVDLCYRMKQKQMPVVYFPKAKIVHTGGQSFKQMLTIKRQLAFNRSLLTYFKKNMPHIQYRILAILQPINLALALIQQVFGIKRGDY